MSSPQPLSLIPSSTPGHRALLEARRKDITDALREVLRGGTEAIVWEVGCGHGHFLEAFARAHPGHVCVGIDIEGDRITRARRKRDRAQLRNLHFLRAEARLFLETVPAELSFSAVFVLFPDPWPKLRHHKHRLIQADFLSAAASRMKPGGRLYFRTDDRAYFEAAEQLVRASSSWRVLDEAWPFEHATVFQNRAAEYRSLVAGVISGPSP